LALASGPNSETRLFSQEPQPITAEVHGLDRHQRLQHRRVRRRERRERARRRRRLAGPRPVGIRGDRLPGPGLQGARPRPAPVDATATPSGFRTDRPTSEAMSLGHVDGSTSWPTRSAAVSRGTRAVPGSRPSSTRNCPRGGWARDAGHYSRTYMGEQARPGSRPGATQRFRSAGRSTPASGAKGSPTLRL